MSRIGFGGLALRSINTSGNLGYIIIVALVALLLPLSGCIDDGTYDDEDKITFALQMAQVTPRDTGSERVWDAELGIMKITPKGSEVKWSSVSVLIKGSDGSVLLQETPVSTDSGTYGSAVEVWYMDSTGGRNQADAGDKLKVTGMDAGDYEGAYVEVMHRGERVASTPLPTDFP
jgi:hypothetical protein